MPLAGPTPIVRGGSVLSSSWTGCFQPSLCCASLRHWIAATVSQADDHGEHSGALHAMSLRLVRFPGAD